LPTDIVDFVVLYFIQQSIERNRNLFKDIQQIEISHIQIIEGVHL